MKSLMLLTSLLLVSISLRSLHAGDPSPDKPFESLQKVGIVEASAAIYEKAEQRDQQIRAAIDKCQKGKSIEVAVINGLIRDINALKSYSSRIQFYGEPAGSDWQYRCMVYEKTWQDLSQKFSSQNNGNIHDLAVSKLDKTQKTRLSTLESIRKLLDQEKIYEAEEKADAMWDQALAVGGFLPIPSREAYFRPCEDASGLVRSKTNPDRLKVGKEIIEKEANAALNSYQKLTSDAKDAARQIAASGIATIGSQKMNGPDAVLAIAVNWKLENISLQRAAVLQRSIPYEGTGRVIGMNKTNRVDEWQATAEKLTSDLQTAIREIIDADAKKLKGRDASNNYMLYLKILGPLASRCREGHWTDSLHDALSRLAKSADASEEMQAYDEATSDLLRWRGRVAKQQAQAMSTKFPPLGQTCATKLAKTKENIGLFMTETMPVDIPWLKHPIPQLAPLLGTNLNELAVSTQNVMRLDTDKNAVWMSRLDRNVYCRVQGEILASEMAKRLATELMIDDLHPPLTIRAAAAAMSAERGDYDSLGGKLSSPVLEATTARFVNLPLSASPIIPFDSIVGGGQGHLALESLTIRCNLAPEWIQHRYFFTKLSR